ncbi:MAG TPA: acetylornithine/succinylornithine family transaminase [Candidatus Methylacidiphilales bacterium]|nr:acetylornithine/succinylornithine family transaminase [Candidatus Methylacidiphilales bacterium]
MTASSPLPVQPSPTQIPSVAEAPAPTEIESLYDKYVVPTVNRGLTLTHGRGRHVWDDKGRRYLDLGGGVAVNSLGHAHPAIRETLARQADLLIHSSNYYYNEGGGRLAQRIVELTGPGKVFFCNSGAEANEAMIKLARKAGHETGRYEIITTLNSFHGRTMATLSATGQDKIKHGFEPLLAGFTHVPFNDLAAVEAAITPKTIAVQIEGIQGEGGVFVASPDYLLGLRELTRKHNLLLLWDGVQCGYFRTGRWQSYQRILENTPGGENFLPDAIAMAKSLGGGYPMGAMWIREPYQNVLGPGSHGTTYGGSPMACAVALTILDVVEREKLAGNIRTRGDELKPSLETLVGTRGIKEVRGFGGIIGMVIEGDPYPAVARLTQAGLILIPAANHTVRFLPPLNVTAEEIAEALRIVKENL